MCAKNRRLKQSERISGGRATHPKALWIFEASPIPPALSMIQTWDAEKIRAFIRVLPNSWDSFDAEIKSL